MDYRIVAALLFLAMTPALEAGEPKAEDRIASLVAADQRPDAATTKELAKGGAMLIDVRTDEEWKEGHVKGAKLAPWQTLELSSPVLPKDKAAPIVTYCRSGARAQLAAQKLRGLGYTRVVAMTGGFEDLKAAGMPTE